MSLVTNHLSIELFPFLIFLAAYRIPPYCIEEPKDMSTDSDSDDEGKEGFSYISTYCRVNPSCGLKSGSIHIDKEFNEVLLHREADPLNKHSKNTYAVDSVFDHIPRPNDHHHGGTDSKGKKLKAKNQFASQEEVWDNVRNQIDRRLQEERSEINVMALGGTGSGKTYTLFGESNMKDMGVCPRFINHVFSGQKPETNNNSSNIAPVIASHIFLSMYLVLPGEDIVDLLHMNNPVVRRHHQNHVGYSTVRVYVDSVMPWLSLYISICHGYHIEGWLLSYRVVHRKANVGLLLSYPAISNFTSIIPILISTSTTTTT